jgi:hypothetical protein
MNYSQIEASLDSLKGEESVFRLYKDGKHKELKEINDVFLKTGLYDVSHFNEILANTKNHKTRVVSVDGEKGAGKSTLVSTVALNQLNSKNIDEIRYLRYESQSQRFKELFKVESEDPKTRVTVVDDVHYFVPDCIDGVLVKGSVQCFDRFVTDLFNIDCLFHDPQFSSTLVYISDTHSTAALQKFFDGVLSSADRTDLSTLLPRVTKTNSPKITIGKEFYGKTYAVLGGNINQYNAAETFGDVMKEENPNLVVNSRLLKHVIKSVRPFSHQINYKIFADDEIAKSIVRGESITPDSIVKQIYKRAEGITTELYQQLETERCKAFSEVRPMIDFISDERKYSNEDFDKTENITKDIVESIDKKSRRTDLGERTVSISQERSLLENSRNHESFAQTFSELTLDSSNRFNAQIKRFYPIFSRMKYELGHGSKTLKEVHQNLEKATADYKRKIRNTSEGLDYYKKVLNKPQKLEKYQSIYAEVKKSAEEFISKSPIMFTTTDTKKIKNIIDNPQEAISRINPHTIDLIRSLDLIPF